MLNSSPMAGESTEVLLHAVLAHRRRPWTATAAGPAARDCCGSKGTGAGGQRPAMRVEECSRLAIEQLTLYCLSS